MAISDIFSSTFLISLVITLFIASMLYIYISNKFAEQNHKINSMFSLISTMAEEQQYFRAKLINKGSSLNELDKAQFASHLIHNNDFEDNNENNNDLISVSDNQDQEEDYYTSDSDSEYEENEDNNADDYNSDDEDNNNIDILNLGLINHDNLGLKETDENNNEIIQEELVDIDSDSTSTINLNNIKTIHLEETITNGLDLSSEINLNEGVELTQDNDNDTINTVDNHSKQEYKKMSLNKLREVIIEKGLIQDASKLKKNEILKMLGDE